MSFPSAYSRLYNFLLHCKLLTSSYLQQSSKQQYFSTVLTFFLSFFIESKPHQKCRSVGNERVINHSGYLNTLPSQAKYSCYFFILFFISKLQLLVLKIKERAKRGCTQKHNNPTTDLHFSLAEMVITDRFQPSAPEARPSSQAKCNTRQRFDITTSAAP